MSKEIPYHDLLRTSYNIIQEIKVHFYQYEIVGIFKRFK